MAPPVEGPCLPTDILLCHERVFDSGEQAGDRPESSSVETEESYASESAFTYCIAPVEKAEIEAALRSFEDLELDGHDVSQANFPLPTLAGKLSALAQELHNGRGFFVLRGLQPEDYTHEQNLIIFLGISSYVGNVRGNQTDDGKIFAHVQNARKMAAGQKSRPLRDSNRACTFHNDLYCDILAMQTHRPALKGGDSILASVGRVYDHMSRTRPNLADLLLKANWPHDLRRRFASTETRPILFRHNGRLVASVLTDSLVGFSDLPRPSGLANMTDEQFEALALFQSIAHDNSVRLPLHGGDLTYINNFAVVHARDEFEDSPEHGRYLVRLWLKNEELSWDLPEELRIGNRAIFYDDELADVWNIYPEARTTFQTYERATP